MVTEARARSPLSPEGLPLHIRATLNREEGYINTLKTTVTPRNVGILTFDGALNTSDQTVTQIHEHETIADRLLKEFGYKPYFGSDLSREARGELYLQEWFMKYLEHCAQIFEGNPDHKHFVQQRDEQRARLNDYRVNVFDLPDLDYPIGIWR